MTTNAAPRPTDVVARMVDEWRSARAALVALEVADHPPLIDVDGRVWTWHACLRPGCDIYTTPRPDLYPPTPDQPEGGRAAWLRPFIQEARADGVPD